jgi:prephenate dehydrogenase
MFPTTLGVIGLGAIGGSVAWRAAQSGVPRIVGYSANRKDVTAAARQRAVTEIASDARRVARESEFLVIAAPPRATLKLLRTVADTVTGGTAFCTDVASVKQPIVALAEQLRMADRFAGSHPFAGTHERGFEAARPDRFDHAVVYVTPLAGGTQAADEIADFWDRVIGAHPVVVPAGQHDELLAWTSHLPQVVSSTLAVTLGRAAPGGARFGSGARDLTRLAAGSVEMWVDVLLMNRSAVLQCLERLDPVLDELKRALADGDGAAVARWLEEGARWRRIQAT